MKEITATSLSIALVGAMATCFGGLFGKLSVIGAGYMTKKV